MRSIPSRQHKDEPDLAARWTSHRLAINNNGGHTTRSGVICSKASSDEKHRATIQKKQAGLMVLMEFCFFGFDQIRPSAISPTTQTKLGRSNANRNKLKRAIHTAHTKAQNPQADCFSFSNSRAEDNGKD